MQNLSIPGLLLLLSVSPTAIAAEQRDYELLIGYTTDLIRNVRGGVKTGSRHLDNLDVSLSFPFGGSLTLPGTFLLSGVYNNGSEFSELVGDLQGAANIDAPEAARVYELWYELPLTTQVSVKAGRMDLNSEFDVLEASQLFLQSSHGIGADFAQSGQNGPSIFPVTTLGARLAYSHENWSIKTAVFDATPGDPDNLESNHLDPGGGTLAVLEVERRWGELRSFAGYWQYSGDFPLLADSSGSSSAGQNNGWYVGVEQTVRKWQWFLRYGEADPQFNPSSAYLGFGVVRNGFYQNHRVGLAVAMAFTGQDYRRANQGVATSERSIEATYQITVNPWFNLQFELQQVDRPAALPNLNTALIAGLRLSFQFENLRF